jgi:hypothetical protein
MRKRVNEEKHTEVMTPQVVLAASQVVRMAATGDVGFERCTDEEEDD